VVVEYIRYTIEDARAQAFEQVRVLDHVADGVVGYRAIDDHGVPMTLVEVVSGKRRSVRRE
jgi:hypothetical protein